MIHDNPAGRLADILEAVRKRSKAENAQTAWQSVFGLPTSDIGPRLTAKIGMTMSLVQQTLDLMEEEHPELTTRMPSWASQVSNAFQVHNVHGTIDNFNNNISDDTIGNIRLAAALLQKGSNRKLLLNDQLAAMRNSVATVLDEVLAAEDLDADVRSYVARALRKILLSIEEYKLTGALPILNAVEAAVGHAVFDPKYKTFLTETTLGKRMQDALQAASCVVTVAVGMPALVNTVQLLLK